MNRLYYVYGIVPSGASPLGGPIGIDDATVDVVEEGGSGALVSELTGEEYAPEHIAAASGDMSWMGARARAHDRVLTAYSDRGPVVPLAMFTSTFASLDAVRAMLRDRADELHRLTARVARGREYILRVYRVDSELKAALPSLNEEIARLSDAAKSASPGQRYLLERKLEERSKEAIRVASQHIAAEVMEGLAPLATESTTAPVPKLTADAPGVMVLNAAYLVSSAQMAAFQKRLTDIVNEREPAGFRFDFSGPWPAYHFAS